MNKHVSQRNILCLTKLKDLIQRYHYGELKEQIQQVFGRECYESIIHPNIRHSLQSSSAATVSTERSILLHSVCTHLQKSDCDNKESELRILRVGAGNPSSLFDLFALSLSRSRADLLITTGKLLRCEPLYTGNLPSTFGSAFLAHKNEMNRDSGKYWPKRSSVCILTESFCDFDHNVFQHTNGKIIIYTNEAHAAALCRLRNPYIIQSNGYSIHRIKIQSVNSSQNEVIVIGSKNISLINCINFLENHPQFYSEDISQIPTFSLECGPKTMYELYKKDSPRKIDILQLTELHTNFTPSESEKYCVQTTDPTLHLTPNIINACFDTLHESISYESGNEWMFRYCTRKLK
jgi:hypothetical protein